MHRESLEERITRSLAYMLRHQPDEFDLELDRQGWGDLDEVVQALQERLGDPIDDEDVREAIEGGDRARYEIDGDRIRALYGHSFPVDPGDPTEPPETLYLGVGSRDASRAEDRGLRSGRRAFLHLARTEEDAREAGRRAARDYAVITVFAQEAYEDGVDFYDRGALFLAEELPAEYLEVGDIQHDGIDRGPRRGGPRRGGRGGRGDDRPRGRGRRDGGRGGPRRDHYESDDRDERPRQDEDQPRERDERPREREEIRPAAPVSERSDSGERDGGGFGLGLDSSPARPKSKPARRAERSEPEPEPAAAADDAGPASAQDSSGDAPDSGFGAGIV